MAWLQPCLPSPAVQSMSWPRPLPRIPNPPQGQQSGQSCVAQCVGASFPRPRAQLLLMLALSAAASAKRGNLPPARRPWEGPSHPWLFYASIKTI